MWLPKKKNDLNKGDTKRHANTGGRDHMGPSPQKELQATKEFWEQEKQCSPVKSIWLVNQYQVLYTAMIGEQVMLLEWYLSIYLYV